MTKEEYQPPQILPQTPFTKYKGKKKGELTIEQEEFVDLLFEHGGDSHQAIAAHSHYSKGSRSWLMRHCADAITARATKFLAAHTAAASVKLVNAMTMGEGNEPVSPFVKQQIKAAESILDRSGVQAVIKIEADVRQMTGVVFLPDKAVEKVIENG